MALLDPPVADAYDGDEAAGGAAPMRRTTSRTNSVMFRTSGLDGNRTIGELRAVWRTLAVVKDALTGASAGAGAEPAATTEGPVRTTEYRRTLVDWLAVLLCMRTDARGPTPASAASQNERRQLNKSLSFEGSGGRTRSAFRRTPSSGSSQMLGASAAAAAGGTPSPSSPGRLSRKSSRDDALAAAGPLSPVPSAGSAPALGSAPAAATMATLDLAMVRPLNGQDGQDGDEGDAGREGMRAMVKG